MGADALLGCQSLGAEQLPPDEEHRRGRDNGGSEGQHKDPSDRPQVQATLLFRPPPGQKSSHPSTTTSQSAANGGNAPPYTAGRRDAA
ncbi:hypothetical protein GCM10022233_65460 [Streptomyces shaanxiensis]|uniref:Transposase n=1 Tax=Streptomyces shaanxiensis TaxID=653357 RepID=A0ABP7VZF3_9ACTN